MGRCCPQRHCLPGWWSLRRGFARRYRSYLRIRCLCPCFGLIARINGTARLIVIICLTVVVRLNGLLHLRGAIKGLGIDGQGHGGEQGQGGQEGRQAAAQGTVDGAVLRHLLPSFLFLSVALCMSVMLAGFCVPRRPDTSPADSTHYFTGLPVK